MNGQTLKIEVQSKVPNGWITEILVFRDLNKIKKVKEIIEKEIGWFSKYLVVNMSSSPLPEGDVDLAISVSTYEKLYSLADEIEFLTPDP